MASEMTQTNTKESALKVREAVEGTCRAGHTQGTRRAHAAHTQRTRSAHKGSKKRNPPCPEGGMYFLLSSSHAAAYRLVRLENGGDVALDDRFIVGLPPLFALLAATAAAAAAAATAAAAAAAPPSLLLLHRLGETVNGRWVGPPRLDAQGGGAESGGQRGGSMGGSAGVLFREDAHLDAVIGERHLKQVDV